MVMGLLSPAFAQVERSSVHAEQMRQLESEEPLAPSDDASERRAMEKDGSLFPLKAAGSKAVRAAKPTVDEDFIVFGYAQSYGSAGTYTDFYRWSGLTHIGSTFVSFDSAGGINTANENVWKNRDANLKAGGAAQAAGVKVIMVCLNSGFDVAVINSVMTSATARAALITEIHNLLAADTYRHGVSFDFEPFAWNSSARAGMVTFFQDLRTSLDTIDPNLEISVYADPSASSTQWDLPAFTPNLDYYLFSCYDYATGTSAHAISDFNNYVSPFTSFYIEGGVPANKMVAVISTYSGRWSGVTAYNTSAGTNRVAGGFTDGLYETTLWPQFGGPKTENYQTGDEVSWHTWLDSGTATNYVRTWDSPQALEYKIRAALSNYTSERHQREQREAASRGWLLVAAVGGRDELVQHERVGWNRGDHRADADLPARLPDLPGDPEEAGDDAVSHQRV
jgi:hypothetical protein